MGMPQRMGHACMPLRASEFLKGFLQSNFFIKFLLLIPNSIFVVLIMIIPFVIFIRGVDYRPGRILSFSMIVDGAMHRIIRDFPSLGLTEMVIT